MPAHRKTSSPNSPCSWFYSKPSVAMREGRGSVRRPLSCLPSAVIISLSQRDGRGNARAGRAARPSTRVPGSPAPARGDSSAGAERSCQPAASQPRECAPRRRRLQPQAAQGAAPRRSSLPPRTVPPRCRAHGQPRVRPRQIPLPKKAGGRALPSQPTQGEGAGEGNAAAVCAGDSWARLLLFPGCFASRVRSAQRPRKEPGTWSRRGRASSVTTHTKAKD
ncbi:uncharacterized protein LOC141580307 [Saimiri boliviensis]|uniref:uncharacterized protein LOC141580307 n=1 Tax=Saimiri boliviensis TaxID=27679 RepID=UPI003D78A8B7